MSSSFSPEEVEQQHLSILGPDLGPVFHALYNDLAWLHVVWQEYRELFADSEARVDLLNRAAPLFFYIVQEALWEDTLLGLCRLTDRPEPGGKSALTLRRLPLLTSDARLRTVLEALVDKAVKSTEFARDWRNRRIAHRDLFLSVSEEAAPLAGASRLLVEEALKAVDAVMNAVYSHYRSSDLSFKVTVPADGAEALASVIRDGLSAYDARIARIKAGNPTSEDLKWPAV